jgi:hypothetical protein
MQRTWRRTLLALLSLLVMAACAGCVSSGPYQWQGSMLDGSPILKSEPGIFVTPQCPSVVRDGKWVAFACTKVAIQPAPPGLEAYSYVYKIKIKSGFGIPYGEVAALAYVVGDRDECERLSAFHNMRTDGRVNEGNLRLSADPNERCAGPVWIRDGQTAAAPQPASPSPR